MQESRGCATSHPAQQICRVASLFHRHPTAIRRKGIIPNSEHFFRSARGPARGGSKAGRRYANVCKSSTSICLDSSSVTASACCHAWARCAFALSAFSAIDSARAKAS